MKILVIGDIVGDCGLKKVKEILPKLKEDEKINFIIANGENSADGMGITKNIFDELLSLGVKVNTMGNHTRAKKDIFSIIQHKQLLVPANYSAKTPGNRYGIYECNGKKICVINLIGRTNMNVLSDNPFIIVEKIITKIKEIDIILIDFHAEATAEKIAMGYFLDGKVSIVFRNTYTCSNSR